MIAQLPTARVNFSEVSESQKETLLSVVLTRGLYGTTFVLGVFFFAYAAYMLTNFVYYKGF
jgi:hypothetical protein